MVKIINSIFILCLVFVFSHGVFALTNIRSAEFVGANNECYFGGNESAVSFTSTSNFTAMGWFNVNNLPSDNERVVGKFGDLERQWTLGVGNTGADTVLRFVTGNGGSGGGNESTLTFNPGDGSLAGEWHHVTAVYRTGSREIWYDGVRSSDDRESITLGTSAANFAVGCQEGDGAVRTDSTFDGFLDEIKVFNTALSTSSINREMSGESGIIESMVAYYKLSNTSGDAVDLTGQISADLTNTNTVTSSLDTPFKETSPSFAF